MKRALKSPWFFRCVAVLVFIVAQGVVLSIPVMVQEPSDWGLRAAVRNFSQGQLVITDDQYIQHSIDARSEGWWFHSYGRVSEDSWAFTSAPGYAFFLVPFEQFGFPQLGLSFLSAGLVAVLYLLLARMRDEKTALIGVILLLFTPLYLAMWQRVYSDALAAFALNGMGGGLYLYYWLSRERLSPRMGAITIFAAGLLLIASITMCYTNIIIAFVFGAHFLVMSIRYFQRKVKILPVGLFFGLGALVPGLGLLIYHGMVFGSPFTYGGAFAQLQVNFAWSYAPGTFYGIVKNNISQLWVPLLIAMPVLIVSAPAIMVVAHGKGFLSRKLDLWPEIPAHIFHLLWVWALVIFGLFAMYDWTSFQDGAKFPFPLLTRFYLPALFPLVIVAALMIRRLSTKYWAGILVALSGLGLLFYVQACRVQIHFGDGAAPPSLDLPAQPESILLELSKDKMS